MNRRKLEKDGSFSRLNHNSDTRRSLERKRYMKLQIKMSTKMCGLLSSKRAWDLYSICLESLQITSRFTCFKDCLGLNSTW